MTHLDPRELAAWLCHRVEQDTSPESCAAIAAELLALPIAERAQLVGLDLDVAPADYPTEYDGPVYVGPEQDEPELVDADVDAGPVPAAGQREAEWQPILCPTCHSPGPCYFLDSGNAMPYWHTAKAELIEAAPDVPVGVQPEPAERTTCEACGAAIPTPRFCASCTAELNRVYEAAMSEGETP